MIESSVIGRSGEGVVEQQLDVGEAARRCIAEIGCSRDFRDLAGDAIVGDRHDRGVFGRRREVVHDIAADENPAVGRVGLVETDAAGAVLDGVAHRLCRDLLGAERAVVRRIDHDAPVGAVVEEVVGDDDIGLGPDSGAPGLISANRVVGAGIDLVAGDDRFPGAVVRIRHADAGAGHIDDIVGHDPAEERCVRLCCFHADRELVAAVAPVAGDLSVTRAVEANGRECGGVDHVAGDLDEIGEVDDHAVSVRTGSAAVRAGEADQVVADDALVAARRAALDVDAVVAGVGDAVVVDDHPAVAGIDRIDGEIAGLGDIAVFDNAAGLVEENAVIARLEQHASFDRQVVDARSRDQRGVAQCGGIGLELARYGDVVAVDLSLIHI